MISKWLQRLRGGSGSSAGSSTEPAAAPPEPPSMPAEPPAPAGMPEEGMSEPSGDEPA